MAIDRRERANTLVLRQGKGIVFVGAVVVGLSVRERASKKGTCGGEDARIDAFFGADPAASKAIAPCAIGVIAIFDTGAEEMIITLISQGA